jgi:ketosteroid isomerase-like protein
MKKLIILFSAVLFLSAQSYSQTAEEEIIKKVCIAETKAFNDFDMDALAAYHVQSANDQLVLNKADGKFSATSGWENISKKLKNYFQTGKKQNAKLASENYVFVIEGNMAFVCYNASSQNAAGKTSQSKEYRTLLKMKGKWKILAGQVYIDYTSGK